MRPFLLVAAAAAAAVSCGTTSALYNWGGGGEVSKYEQLAYGNYKKQTPESVCALVVLYEGMTAHPGGQRGVPPPGICAEYGYLLLQPETAATFLQYASASQKRVFGNVDYSALFTEKGREMLQKEVELYPESATFINPLIKKWIGR